ncbi:MAG: ABC transporter permease [Bacteroidota bacterium]
MIQHNFRIGFRLLLKNKGFSALNIGGLALGMTVAILIALWIADEFAYNRNHDHYDRLVQVLTLQVEEGVPDVNDSHVGMAGVFLKEQYSNYFENVAMTFYRPNFQMLEAGDFASEEWGYVFQADIPEMLSLDMKMGTHDALRDPSNIIISETLAQKFFQDEDPIGQAITINTARELLVAGVFEDLPQNSTFGEANFFVSMELVYNEENPYAWDNWNMKVYAQLRENASMEDASLAIKEMLLPHMDFGDEPKECFLLPMADWHLNAHFVDGVQQTSPRMKFVRLYAIIGGLVLLIAFINFVNLNTARFQQRGKEVGIRKTLGSYRINLIRQYLAESTLYAVAAFVLSIIVVALVLPGFNVLAEKEIALPWTNLVFWGLGLGFILATALIAGIYPAVFLSSFHPIQALKGKLKQGRASVNLRQGLVVFQFVVSIFMVISTVVVHQQIQHAKNREVGYSQERLITMRGRSGDFYDKGEVLQTTLKQTGVVTAVGNANYPLMNTLGNNDGFSLTRTGEEFPVSFNTVRVSPGYGPATKWELVAGRDFSPDRDEKASIILSESAVAAMGLDNPIGEVISSPEWFTSVPKQLTIIGVVRDMIKSSPFEPPMPLIALHATSTERYMFVRIGPQVEYSEALMKIKQAYATVLPDEPFYFRFVEDEYFTKFKAEEQVGSLATLFSVLAILISCLGLFGLSAYVVHQRVKEIGIRKVLGATVANLWLLLSRDFGKLVLVACVLAIPISFYLVRGWLADYPYRIELAWWIFALGGISCLLITLGVVSFHTLRATFSNPIKALKTE